MKRESKEEDYQKRGQSFDLSVLLLSDKSFRPPDTDLLPRSITCIWNDSFYFSIFRRNGLAERFHLRRRAKPREMSRDYLVNRQGRNYKAQEKDRERSRTIENERGMPLDTEGQVYAIAAISSIAQNLVAVISHAYTGPSTHLIRGLTGLEL